MKLLEVMDVLDCGESFIDVKTDQIVYLKYMQFIKC